MAVFPFLTCKRREEDGKEERKVYRRRKIRRRKAVDIRGTHTTAWASKTKEESAMGTKIYTKTIITAKFVLVESADSSLSFSNV